MLKFETENMNKWIITFQVRSMPWLTLPYTDRRKARVQFDYGVLGVPKLIIVDETNQLITTDGRGAISTDTHGAVST